MPTVETYFITWKGRRDGPYSIEQLEELLKNGDVGLLHSVETSLGPVSLRQLLETAHPPPSPADNSTSAEMPATTSPAVGTNFDEQEAWRLYATCGWCFALPPLAWRAWRQARRLAEQGHEKMAERIQWLSAGLALAGVLMWILLWRIW